MSNSGSLAGIKVDTGAKPLAGSLDEKITEGLDGLRDRLKEYSKLKNYDFIEKPSESDLDDFATFETLPLIMDKGDKDAFMNLLTHSHRQELYSAEKPKIITVKKTHTTAMVNRGDREILFTQVFLLKSKKEMKYFTT